MDQCERGGGESPELTDFDLKALRLKHFLLLEEKQSYKSSGEKGKA